MRWMGHSMGEMRDVYLTLARKPHVKRPLGKPKIILQLIL
jgi:hypothetical protein